MAYLLAESAKLTQDMLIKGIIQEIIKASPILGGPYIIDAYGMKGGPSLPFMEVAGNALAYNREVDPTNMAVWHAPLDSWAADNLPTWAPISTALKIVGAQAQIDDFIQQTRSDKMDQTAAVIAEASKAIAFAYEDKFIYGAVAAQTFDGIHAFCNTNTGQRLTVKAAATNTDTPLTTAMLDNLIDKVLPAPDILLMNRAKRNLLSQFSRKLTSPVQYLPQQFGMGVTLYNGIPVAISDFIVETEATDASGWYSAKTGGTAISSIFAIKFGDRNLCGIQNGGIQKQMIGEMEAADSKLWRIKWYCGLAEFAAVSVACLSNVPNLAIVA